MDIIPEPEHVNLEHHLMRAVTAAEAVREGIATHAQKEHAARDEKRREMEALRKLRAGSDAGG